MSLREDLATAERIIGKQDEEISTLKYTIQELKEELNHYKTAIAAVKWLWDRASEQRPFQL